MWGRKPLNAIYYYINKIVGFCDSVANGLNTVICTFPRAGSIPLKNYCRQKLNKFFNKEWQTACFGQLTEIVLHTSHP
jgi:hypothetical protein